MLKLPDNMKQSFEPTYNDKAMPAHTAMDIAIADEDVSGNQCYSSPFTTTSNSRHYSDIGRSFTFLALASRCELLSEITMLRTTRK